MLYLNMECCSVSPVWKDKIISRAWSRLGWWKAMSDFCMIVDIETSNMEIEPLEHKVLSTFFYTRAFYFSIHKPLNVIKHLSKSIYIILLMFCLNIKHLKIAPAMRFNAHRICILGAPNSSSSCAWHAVPYTVRFLLPFRYLYQNQQHSTLLTQS